MKNNKTIFIANKINKEVTNNIIQESDKLISDTTYFTNNYFINNGRCFDIAEKQCSIDNIELCSNDIMGYHEDFKIKMLNTLSPNVNKDSIFSLISRVNHDWNFDLNNKIHLDSEIPHGVKYLDDIPVFSRIIAKAILLENAKIGGKWTKKLAQTIVDEIPFSAIENFDDKNLKMRESDINHIRLNLKYMSQHSFQKFINLSKFNFDNFSSNKPTIKSKNSRIKP